MALPITESRELQNPFPGLRSFEPDEEHLFFGREEQIDELLTRLRLTRFLTVVGTSGSGKSSVVRSGLIPALYSGYMAKVGSSWRIAILRPGDDPIGNVAASLTEPHVFADDGSPPQMRRAIIDATLRRGALGLVESVKQARLPVGENLLLVVDQFEEIFRFKRGTKSTAVDEAAAFIKILLEAAHQEDLPIYVVLTMRSDFLGNCTEFQDLPDAINQGLYLIPRMTREQRRSAIEGPVAVGGASISSGLVMRLLNDVGDSPDQLPIMQHALMRTWDYWQENHAAGDPLDLRHYEAIGSMKEALSLHAEEAYHELRTESARRCAGKLFRSLTEKGLDGRGVRRPIAIGDVCAEAGVASKDVFEVVELFRRPGRSFLMPDASVPLTDDTILDISHESLMRVWTRLTEWVDEEAQGAQTYRRLARAAELHQEGTAGLWRDPELQLGLSWQEANQPTSAWALRYDSSFERAMTFLGLSRDERDRWIGQKEAMRRRQLRRTRSFAVVVSCLALLSLLFMVYAFILQGRAQDEQAAALEAESLARKAETAAREAQDDAEQQRDLAESERVRAETEKNRADQARQEEERQRQVAVENARLAQLQELEARRQKELADTNAALASASAEQALRQTAIAEEARKDAEASEAESRRLRLLDLGRGIAGQIPRIQRDAGPEVAALVALEAFRLNRENGGPAQSAGIYHGLSAALEGLDAGVERTFEGHDEAVRAMAANPITGALASGDEDGDLRLLDTEDPAAELTESHRLQAAIRTLAFAPNGSTLAAGLRDGSIFTLEQSGVSDPVLLGSHGDLVRSVVFAPGGELLASASADGTVGLWQLTSRQRRATLEDSAKSQVFSVAFSPDGRHLAAAFASSHIGVWRIDGDTAAPVREFSMPSEARSVAWSRDGSFLAGGDRDGTVALWDFSSPRTQPTSTAVGHVSSINTLTFSPDGDSLVSSSSDHTLRIWSFLSADQPPIVLRGLDSWIWAAAVTKDGRTVFAGGADRSLRRWAARAEYLAERVCSTPGVTRNLTEAEWYQVFPEDIPYKTTCPGLPRS